MSTVSDDEQLAEGLAEMLVYIEYNWQREGSGPGSRFEGQPMEVVQARAAIRYLRAHGWGGR